MSDYTLLLGDAATMLKTLPANSVQCCVTSPPYFGLRAYLHNGHDDKHLEIGTEETPDAYVAKLADVFREVRRVLHPTGVLFLNLGDSYWGSWGNSGNRPELDGKPSTQRKKSVAYLPRGGYKEHRQRPATSYALPGLKPKDLIGIPWMVAFALRADGWYLRSEIIWHKKAPMPESVTDRPTKAHEQVFLLAKSPTYFYDAEAIAETATDNKPRPPKVNRWEGQSGHDTKAGFLNGTRAYATRNKRSVWSLGPEPYDKAHFATMPTKLVEPCILAGTSAHGCCSKCGSPWERVVERGETQNRTTQNGHGNGELGSYGRFGDDVSTTTGWQPTCTCNGHFELIQPEPDYDEDGDETVASQLRPPRRVFVADGELPEPVPCTVLDPFFGSGTVAAVALKHGRRFVGIDLDERNIQLAHDRIGRSQPLLLAVTA